jgi:hypothetical protein
MKEECIKDAECAQWFGYILWSTIILIGLLVLIFLGEGLGFIFVLGGLWKFYEDWQADDWRKPFLVCENCAHRMELRIDD